MPFFPSMPEDATTKNVFKTHPEIYAHHVRVSEAILRGPSPLTAAQRELINCYDPSGFALPAQYTFGNAPRNVLRGPNYKVTDLSLMKNIPLGKDVRFQIRAEVYNVFNRANFGNPNASFGSTAFGSITALATGATMRRVQVGGKLLF